MCQFHWFSWSPIFSQTQFSGYVWEYCWMRLIFKSVDWGKLIALPSVGGPCPISWSSGFHKKFWTSQEEEGTPPAWLLGWNVTFLLLWLFLRFILVAFGQTLILLALLVLHLRDDRLSDFSVPIMKWANSIYINAIGSVSLENPNIPLNVGFYWGFVLPIFLLIPHAVLR